MISNWNWNIIAVKVVTMTKAFYWRSFFIRNESCQSQIMVNKLAKMRKHIGYMRYHIKFMMNVHSNFPRIRQYSSHYRSSSWHNPLKWSFAHSPPGIIFVIAGAIGTAIWIGKITPWALAIALAALRPNVDKSWISLARLLPPGVKTSSVIETMELYKDFFVPQGFCEEFYEKIIRFKSIKGFNKKKIQPEEKLDRVFGIIQDDLKIDGIFQISFIFFQLIDQQSIKKIFELGDLLKKTNIENKDFKRKKITIVQL
ncbi:hypothetical protein BpHYR1_048885 [Brachionus plicatilis]|uniref:Uncharacterized protein n=1 Tax=Brachionus plicatilis TaxID=10195 RepID=A0A3M7QJ67_BRAPC|nr:hypothetical protein BpHYR1_048885 [Brachionus plicatilis]